MQAHLPQISKAKDLCRQLCDSAKDPATKGDLRAKMTALDKDINETVKKLGKISFLLFRNVKSTCTFYDVSLLVTLNHFVGV